MINIFCTIIFIFTVLLAGTLAGLFVVGLAYTVDFITGEWWWSHGYYKRKYNGERQINIFRLPGYLRKIINKVMS